MFDYTLIVNYGLTPNGRLVDCLPYSYEWVMTGHLTLFYHVFQLFLVGFSSKKKEY